MPPTRRFASRSPSGGWVPMPSTLPWPVGGPEMRAAEPEAFDVLLAVVAALDEVGVPYVVGGSPARWRGLGPAMAGCHRRPQDPGGGARSRLSGADGARRGPR